MPEINILKTLFHFVLIFTNLRVLMKAFHGWNSHSYWHLHIPHDDANKIDLPLIHAKGSLVSVGKGRFRFLTRDREREGRNPRNVLSWRFADLEKSGFYFTTNSGQIGISFCSLHFAGLRSTAVSQRGWHSVLLVFGWSIDLWSDWSRRSDLNRGPADYEWYEIA